MNVMHPVALLVYGALAGGLIAWFGTRSREKAKTTPLLTEYGAQIERLRESERNKDRALKERTDRIDRLEEKLAQTEKNFLTVSREHAAAQARLEQIPGLRQAVEQKMAEIKNLAGELSHLKEAQTALETTLEKERSSMAEKLQLLKTAKDQLTDTFEAVSVKALKNSQESFLELAKVAFSRDQETALKEMEHRKEEVSRIVQPIRETLEKYDRHVQDMERMREKAYGGLSQQVQSLATTQQQLHKETANLVKALRTPQIRGRWGEITLRRVAELAGMLNYCDFVEQETKNTENGRLRPDMVVNLPNNRQIVVDSKVPLMAFLEALEAETAEKRKEKLSLHARQVQTHLNSLSQKSYWEQFQPSPEFVVLFIPGENFFSAALEHHPGLIEDGVEKGVILATPTTLIALLKAIAFGWRQETMARNAEQISALGMTLYDRIGTMAHHLDKLGTQIERCAAIFNQTAGSFERRVLVAARRFRDFGVDNKGGEIAQINPTEKKVRNIVLLDEETKKTTAADA